VVKRGREWEKRGERRGDKRRDEEKHHEKRRSLDIIIVTYFIIS
jgi:hypothetical protein